MSKDDEKPKLVKKTDESGKAHFYIEGASKKPPKAVKRKVSLLEKRRKRDQRIVEEAIRELAGRFNADHVTVFVTLMAFSSVKDEDLVDKFGGDSRKLGGVLAGLSKICLNRGYESPVYKLPSVKGNVYRYHLRADWAESQILKAIIEDDD